MVDSRALKALGPHGHEGSTPSSGTAGKLASTWAFSAELRLDGLHTGALAMSRLAQVWRGS